MSSLSFYRKTGKNASRPRLGARRYSKQQLLFGLMHLSGNLPYTKITVTDWLVRRAGLLGQIQVVGAGLRFRI
ncbi:MAG: hypothetical protein QOJ42_5710 [Acidobacteriaceae bacterium]|jgi:hypothetical protein|nr:hypothetical protein [Acidobacteriaceae bacterium]MDX6461674.1 hypothetical protein [Acidobacteriaceae bacterium]MEA3007329.1 hypothetical protein [Acidobacteriaceae bacterium]